MPYIAQDIRQDIDNALETLIEAVKNACRGYDEAAFAGVLNYCFTRMIMRTILEGKVRYWKLALVSGLFATLVAEFERRVVMPYEKGAREKAGDVPEYAVFDGEKNRE